MRVEVPEMSHTLTITISEARIRTLRAAMGSKSQASDFFAHSLSQLNSNKPVDPRGAISHAARDCEKFNCTITQCLLSDSPPRMTNLPPADGLTDSIRQLLTFYSIENCDILNDLLRSY